MCGITGIIDLNGGHIDRDLLEQMKNELRHRGPDDEGSYFHEYPGTFSVALGHKRLSIIDLSEHGRQPMSNEDETVWLVFNGEIYNFKELKQQLAAKGHRFASATDAEVIIHLYEECGEYCVEYLRGMFAFCLWDARQNKLIFARDRVGKKPLVYYRSGSRLIFASELKALLKDPSVSRDLDHTAVMDFFTYGYVPSPKSIFKNISKLPPAHLMIIDAQGMRIKKYWQPDYNNKLRFPREKDYEEEIGRHLDEAVRLRMASDVPLGLFLSGGIDSGAVLAFMSRYMSQPVKSFSIGFENAAFNELSYARSMAEKYRTDHTEFIVKMDAMKMLPRLVWFYNEPFADSSALPTYYVAQNTRRHVKVALCGDGGDEGFGGYNRYVAYRFLRGTGAAKKMTARAARAVVRMLPGHGGRSRQYALRFAEAVLSSDNVDERYLSIMGFFPGLDIFTERFFEGTGAYDARGYFRSKFSALRAEDPREQCMELDFLTNLPEDLMVKADIAAMANGLEVRSPFLDHKLLEFALRIPFEQKIRFFRTKLILKQYLKRRELLTPDVLSKKKQGFAVPIGDWFKGECGAFLNTIVEDSVFAKSGFYDTARIRAILDEHKRGVRDHSHRLWSVLNFELWHRIFIEGADPGSLAGITG